MALSKPTNKPKSTYDFAGGFITFVLCSSVGIGLILLPGYVYLIAFKLLLTLFVIFCIGLFIWCIWYRLHDAQKRADKKSTHYNKKGNKTNAYN